MKVKIKILHADAVIPKYSQSGDAGLDLTAVEMYFDNKYIEYGTGLSVSIPEGYVGLLFPRSSVSKKDLSLANSVGVIDSNYRGEIKLRFKHTLVETYPYLQGIVPGTETYDIGDRVGQLIILPYPQVEFEEVDELDDTERGSGGFGSTGA